MKKLSSLLNEKVTDVKWLKNSIEHVMGYMLPLTNSIAKELGLGERIEAVHFTNAQGAMKLIALQGTKKSISVMTQIPKSNLPTLDGIHRRGVMYKLEGTLLFPSKSDMGSVPDQRGRRWVDVRSIGTIKLWESYKNFLYSNSKYKNLVGDYEYVNKYKDNASYPEINEEMVNDIAKKLISLHFDLSLEFIRKNKKEIDFTSKKNIEITSDYVYNELIVNEIKLLAVVYDKLSIPSKTLEQKIINSVPPKKAIGVEVKEAEEDWRPGQPNLDKDIVLNAAIKLLKM